MDLKSKIFEIQKLISQNKFSSAYAKCEKLIKKIPDNSYILNLTGLVLQRKGLIQKSINYFQKAIIHEPKNYAAMNNLANAYKSLLDFKKSEDLYKKVLNEDPQNIKALNNYANLKRDINSYEDAKTLLLKAINIDPKNVTILLSLALCCQGLGEMTDAKNFALKILDIQPTNTSAHKLLSTIFNYKKDPTHLEQMKKLLTNEKFQNFSLSEKSELYFSIGKAYEDIKDFETSYKYLNEANIIVRQNYKYDLASNNKLFQKIKKLFDSIELKNFIKNESKKKNIFICGMPRSGTTLVEQIVASHSEVSGAGEVHYLSNIIDKYFLQNENFNKSEILNQMFKSNNIIFNEYNNLLDFHKFGSNIITDKAPQNFIWIGFIKILFPNSKIIHCHRNPKDNCLSLYKNHFSSKSMYWAYDQKDIADYYVLYSKFMNYWKTKFKDSIFDANYENIVNFPEKEIKKIISYCDLTWEPECLNFYQNSKTPVQTVSVSQASKPIYKSSINSNQGFAQYLTEMFDILDTKL